jgi:hypothetical protein
MLYFGTHQPNLQAHPPSIILSGESFEEANAVEGRNHLL